MVLDDYGKKTDLPIHTHKLSPRKSLKVVKRIGLGLIALVALLVIFKAFLNKEEPDVFKDIKDTYEKYLVTKDGVKLEEAVVDGQAVDISSGTQEEGEVEKEGEVVEELTKEYPLNEEGEPDIYKLNVEFYDLNKYTGLSEGDKEGDYILFLMPLRNAEHVLPMAFFNIMNLTYDHSLIDIAFLVSDCSPEDTTLETVFSYSMLLQNGTLAAKLQADEEEKRNANVQGSSELYKLYMPQDYMENVEKSYLHPEKQHPGFQKPFRSVTIFRKDFGQVIGQGFSDRHAVKVQGIRRKLMGRARNWLTASALKPYHSWIYWRDVDIETTPGSVIQDLMKHNFDVMVPNVWRPLPTFLGNEQAYDLNTWIESEPAIELAKKLDEDDVIVEGYAEYPTWRVHLAYIRNPKGDPNEVVAMDGVGGVSILARAKIFRQGVHFPAFTFLNHAETEAFGKMAKVMKFSVGGLPHYTIWHIYEPSEDDLKKIAQMERKKRRKGH